TLGDWKIGSPGVSQVSATVPGFTGPAAVFTTTAVVRPFTIDIRFIGTLPSADLRDDYIAAAMRWMEIIVGDLPDVAVNMSAPCQNRFGEPAVNEVVDDMVIFASITTIDGRGGVLGQASDCTNRSGSQLTSVGAMEFDIADAQSLHNSGQFTAVAIHEMGHVLGFLGRRFSLRNLIVGFGGADPYFPGAAAVAAWPGLGIEYAGSLVPLENTGGQGTANSHWREDILVAELMTGWIEAAGDYMPLSAITAAAMFDLGYQVDMSKADPFLPTLMAAPARGGRRFNLHELQPTGWVP
ncbi:MAG TPA: leishmanolysin-related zinc metalloendopeptidase, partial [Gemmatimonadales bacterium]|nr:leishmanolysin-related zinc metalloendopeptidase [Gemmatimonadales bacterium]